MYRYVYNNNNKGPIRGDIYNIGGQIYGCSKQTLYALGLSLSTATNSWHCTITVTKSAQEQVA